MLCSAEGLIASWSSPDVWLKLCWKSQSRDRSSSVPVLSASITRSWLHGTRLFVSYLTTGLVTVGLPEAFDWFTDALSLLDVRLALLGRLPSSFGGQFLWIKWLILRTWSTDVMAPWVTLSGTFTFRRTSFCIWELKTFMTELGLTGCWFGDCGPLASLPTSRSSFGIRAMGLAYLR